jgi:hypothetical protein
MKFLVAAASIAAFTPFAAQAQSAADIQSLRDEIQQLRTQYEARIKALEAKLETAQSQTAAPAPAPAAPAPVAAAAPAGPPSSSTSFNPAMSLILSGTATRTSRDPAGYRISGFSLPPDAQVGPGTRGFSLAESELGISASIDPWFSGAAAISFHPDDTVSVEEAYVQTTSLGNGLTLKAGRWFSSIGYLNSQHAHVWDFVDAPLAYQAMLGGQFADDGLQVAWVAPTDLLVEVRGELGRGRSYPGSGVSRNGAGASALSLHVGGDVGDSSSWRVGASMLNAKAAGQVMLSDTPDATLRTDAFTGSTRVWVADAVWKWAPNGNATRTNFKLQGEYLRSTRTGVLDFAPNGTPDLPFAHESSGWYLQAIYQFMRGWRVGARTERLDSGTFRYPYPVALFETGFKPHKNSLMLDWSPSEFSRVRLQYARDLARPGAPDNQWMLQYQMSLGAHGAHSF